MEKFCLLWGTSLQISVYCCTEHPRPRPREGRAATLKDTPCARNREQSAGASALQPAGRGSTAVSRAAKGLRDKPDQRDIPAVTARYSDHRPPALTCACEVAVRCRWRSLGCVIIQKQATGGDLPKTKAVPVPERRVGCLVRSIKPRARPRRSPMIADLPGRSNPARRSPTATPPIAASGAWSKKTRCSLMAVYP